MPIYFIYPFPRIIEHFVCFVIPKVDNHSTKLNIIVMNFICRPVKVVRLISRDTVEEIVLKRAEAKLKLTNTVIEGGQVITLCPEPSFTQLPVQNVFKGLSLN